MIETGQGRFSGLPIHWSQQQAVLLETTGRMRLFEIEQIAKHYLLDETFVPQTLTQSRAQLQVELGRDFEVSVAGPYVVASPVGSNQRWSAKFRSLLAGFTRFWSVRGWNLRTADFPLVVIVLPSQQAFLHMAGQETGGQIARNIAGVYVPSTNRCLLYHQSSGSHQGTDWQETEATIIHEAVHQLAYNTGLHQRLQDHPLWQVEGLATMFEVSAVYEGHSSTVLRDRIHQSSVQVLKRNSADPSRLASQLQSVIVSDRLYRADPETAYAVSWALTFYLIERMPQQYHAYLKQQLQASRPDSSGAERELEFSRAFGLTVDQLAPQIQRMLASEEMPVSFGGKK